MFGDCGSPSRKVKCSIDRSATGTTLARMDGPPVASRSCPPLWRSWKLASPGWKSGRQLGHGLLPRLLVTRLAGRVDLGVADHAVLVDQEGTADRQPGVFVEHAVGLGHLAVRPEIRQQRELIALLLGPRLQ